MRIMLIMFLVGALCQPCRSQTLGQLFFSPAGGDVSTSSLQGSWNLGLVNGGMVETASYVVRTQGFVLNTGYLITDLNNQSGPLTIYPNPFNDILNILSDVENQQYQIFDQQGKLILHGEAVKNQINLSEVDSGIYQIILTNHGSKAYSFRIQKL